MEHISNSSSLESLLVMKPVKIENTMESSLEFDLLQHSDDNVLWRTWFNFADKNLLWVALDEVQEFFHIGEIVCAACLDIDQSWT